MCSIGRGPGDDMFESVRIIGERQADLGQQLFTAAATQGVQLTGPVDYIHTYIDMSSQAVAFNGTTVNTCLPAMGYSFAAGVCVWRTAVFPAGC